jgi:phosphoribosylglycinamide formyltransferase 1
MELKLGFMASHNGSNVKAIVENIEKGDLDAEAKVVISNNPKAGVLSIAREKGIPCHCINKRNYNYAYNSSDDAIRMTLQKHCVNLVVLAGYMKLVHEEIHKEYRNRIINIHPALLPKYGGKGMYGGCVHKAVIESEDTESGASVHIANEVYDGGRILAQCRVRRYARDTSESLARRVLKAEHVLYSQVLRDIGEGKIDLDE